MARNQKTTQPIGRTASGGALDAFLGEAVAALGAAVGAVLSRVEASGAAVVGDANDQAREARSDEEEREADGEHGGAAVEGVFFTHTGPGAQDFDALARADGEGELFEHEVGADGDEDCGCGTRERGDEPPRCVDGGGCERLVWFHGVLDAHGTGLCGGVRKPDTLTA